MTSVYPFTRSAAQIAALRSLCRAWQEGPQTFWSFDDVLAAVMRPSSAAFFAAADPDSGWLGLILADVGPFTADLLYIYVRPEHRRHQIGRRLLQQLVSELSARPQIEALFLEVRASNTGAQQLYLALGMEEIGRRRRYYSDGEDALIYRYNFSRVSDAPKTEGAT